LHGIVEFFVESDLHPREALQLFFKLEHFLHDRVRPLRKFLEHLPVKINAAWVIHVDLGRIFVQLLDVKLLHRFTVLDVCRLAQNCRMRYFFLHLLWRYM